MVGCIAGSSPLGIFVRSCKKWRGPHWTLFYLPKHLQLRLDLILFNEVLQCLTGRFTGSHWTCRESNSGATSRHLVQIIKKVVQQLQQSPRQNLVQPLTTGPCSSNLGQKPCAFSYTNSNVVFLSKQNTSSTLPIFPTAENQHKHMTCCATNRGNPRLLHDVAQG